MNNQLIQRILFLNTINENFSKEKALVINNDIKFDIKYEAKQEVGEMDGCTYTNHYFNIEMYIYSIKTSSATVRVDDKYASYFIKNDTNKYDLAVSLLQLYSDKFYFNNKLDNAMHISKEENFFTVPNRVTNDINKQFFIAKEELLESVEVYEAKQREEQKQKQLIINQYKIKGEQNER